MLMCCLSMEANGQSSAEDALNCTVPALGGHGRRISLCKGAVEFRSNQVAMCPEDQQRPFQEDQDTKTE